MRNLSRITARAARALLKSLGRPVQYVRFSADPEAVPQDVVAVFNNASKTIGLGGYEVPVGATSPTLFVLEADLGFPPAQGDRAIVAGRDLYGHRPPA